MKGKLARVKYDVNLYKYQVSDHVWDGVYAPNADDAQADALTDDLVIIINTDCHSADEYLVHHQRLGKQYYISKLALELAE